MARYGLSLTESPSPSPSPTPSPTSTSSDDGTSTFNQPLVIIVPRSAAAVTDAARRYNSHVFAGPGVKHFDNETRIGAEHCCIRFGDLAAAPRLTVGTSRASVLRLDDNESDVDQEEFQLSLDVQSGTVWLGKTSRFSHWRVEPQQGHLVSENGAISVSGAARVVFGCGERYAFDVLCAAPWIGTETWRKCVEAYARTVVHIPSAGIGDGMDASTALAPPDSSIDPALMIPTAGGSGGGGAVQGGTLDDRDVDDPRTSADPDDASHLVTGHTAERPEHARARDDPNLSVPGAYPSLAPGDVGSSLERPVVEHDVWESTSESSLCDSSASASSASSQSSLALDAPTVEAMTGSSRRTAGSEEGKVGDGFSSHADKAIVDADVMTDLANRRPKTQDGNPASRTAAVEQAQAQRRRSKWLRGPPSVVNLEARVQLMPKFGSMRTSPWPGSISPDRAHINRGGAGYGIWAWHGNGCHDEY